MTENANDIASSDYWENVYMSTTPSALPSGLSVSVRNMRRLLSQYTKETGQKVMEIGCAPGHMLCWLALHNDILPSGIDYSKSGIAATQAVFDQYQREIALYCEDVTTNQTLNNSFDLVYSNGVIEHFQDPTPMVNKHIDFLKTGGTAVITVPNYRSIYGTLQHYFAPENLSIHNLEIMSPADLLALVPADIRPHARAFYYGAMSPGLVWFNQKWPRVIARPLAYAINLLGLLQPITIATFAPLIVLEINKP